MSSLEDAALARKEKLLALRKRKAEAEAGGATTTAATTAASQGIEDEPSAKQARLEFKFRSYDPATGQARKHTKSTSGGGRSDDAEGEEETVESATKNLIREALQADRERRQQELDLLNIQPKKPNWDLKRDLEKRLDKLRPKTQSAINTLIRQRLMASRKGQSGTQAAAGGEDMAEAIGRRDIREEEHDVDMSDEEV